MEMNSIEELTSLIEIEVENEVEVDTEVLFRVGETFGNYGTLEKKLKDFEHFLTILETKCEDSSYCQESD